MSTDVQVLGEYFRDQFERDDLPNETLREIYRYWLTMKQSAGAEKERDVPARSALNPAEIPHLLPHISLVDVEMVPRRYRMRLIGSETVRAMNKDVTGLYLDDIPEAEHHLRVRYDWLVTEKRPYFYADKLLWAEKKFMEYYALGLPLSRDGKTVDMLMFGMYYQFPETFERKSLM